MYTWEIEIEVWPYSTGRGKDTDQLQAGARVQKYIANNLSEIREAMVFAETICLGLKQNPIVYRTSIKCIEQAEYGSGPTRVECKTERGECYIK